VVDLDNHRILSQLDHDEGEALELAVDGAPAYELVMSFLTFAERFKHCMDELGHDWPARVRQSLPPGFPARPAGFKPKRDEDLLLRLVRGCPVARDAASWLDWLAELSPGAAYEVTAGLTPEGDPPLPRDFVSWRDHLASALRAWHDGYFATLDPAILDGLGRETDVLRRRLGTRPPRELVEEVTNGIWIEPSAGLRRIELVPQYHLRPYNHDAHLPNGLLILYPADSVANSSDGPPVGLLRLTRGLADESRLRMLRWLAQGTKSLSELARLAGLSQPTVHHHLTQLRAAGLVRLHITTGPSRRYSLRPHALDQLTEQLALYLEVPA